MNKLQVEHTALQNERDDLAAASARLQSLDTVKNSSEAKSLVAVAPSGTVE
jgi:division protein CdvB (Snf7/Vps24/ESCRT-III family)